MSFSCGHQLSDYQSIVFDCDGVLLRSNHIKTEAFRLSALDYGEDIAQRLVGYHVENGGISRYKKFSYLLTDILGQSADEEKVTQLCQIFSGHVVDGLMKCEMTQALPKLRRQSHQSSWSVISGGDQNEVRQVLSERGIADYFDAGIFGSPDNKETIMEREMNNGNIHLPALYLGDSKYDYHVSTKYGMDFLFISHWTELDDWQGFCQKNNLFSIANLSDLTMDFSG